MVRAKLRIASDNLSLAEISQAMGRAPDGGFDRGSPRRGPGGVYQHTLWTLELEHTGDRPFGLYGLTEAVSHLDLDLADRARALVNDGCRVVLGVLQEFSPGEDESDDGLVLEEDAVLWLARAGASIDIDQYMLRS